MDDNYAIPRKGKETPAIPISEPEIECRLLRARELLLQAIIIMETRGRVESETMEVEEENILRAILQSAWPNEY